MNDLSRSLKQFAFFASLLLPASSSGLCSEPDKPQFSGKLKVEQSKTPFAWKLQLPIPKPGFVAIIRINSPKVTYSRWFDGYVSATLRDRLYYKGMHLLYPHHRIERSLPDVTLKRQRNVQPANLIPLNKRITSFPKRKFDKKTLALLKKIIKAEAKLLKPVPPPNPIAVVWGMRFADGEPADRLIFYANGTVNDPAGKLKPAEKATWSWSAGKLTVIFPQKNILEFTVSKDGRTFVGQWYDGTPRRGRMLGVAKIRTMPIVASWHLQNVKKGVTTLYLYANGKVNDQHSQSTWSWNAGKIIIDEGKGGSLTVSSNGRRMKGQWGEHKAVAATIYNPIVSFTKIPSKKKGDPELYASLDRSTADYLKLLVKHVPKNRRPSVEVTDYLTKKTNDANFRIITVSETSVEFQILASTARQAEALARGLMTIYDYGTVQPIRQFLKIRLQNVQKDYRERQAVVKKLKQELGPILENTKDKEKVKAARSRLARPIYHVGKSGRILGATGHVVRKYKTLEVVGNKIVIRPVK